MGFSRTLTNAENVMLNGATLAPALRAGRSAGEHLYYRERDFSVAEKRFLRVTWSTSPFQALDQKEHLGCICIIERRIISQRLFTRTVENGDDCLHNFFTSV